MPDEKRIKDFEPAAAIEADDWFAIDSPTQGTRKVQRSMMLSAIQAEVTANTDKNAVQDGQIGTLQLGVSGLREDVDNLEGAVTTDVYNSLSTYAVGDYCIYENVMYKCNTAISTPEAWNSSHWTATSIEGEIKSLNTSLTQLNNKYNFVSYSFDKGSIGANSYMYATENVSLSGYTPKGIIQVTNTGTGNAWIQIFAFYIQGNSAIIGFANQTTATNYTIKGSVTVLYEKNN